MKIVGEQKFNFSVIMAIYNVEKYLEEAILSVINQTLTFSENIQLILVNDGSPDNSDKICRKYQEMYPNNIIYIAKENGGVSSARNAGLKVAKGKYINFLDSDDYFTLDAFEKVLNFFNQHETETNVVALKLINFENSEGTWVNGPFFENTQLIDMREKYNFMQTQVGASFIKSEFAKKYWFDSKIKIHEDSQYLYKIFAHNPTCGVISDAIYWHRIRANGSSATQTINNKENVFNITQYVFNELINFYKNKYRRIPQYLQTFILLEFNYYVIERIQSCNLDKNEFSKIKKQIKYVLNNINKESIIKHFVLSEEQKQILLILKRKINKLDSFYLKEYKKFYNNLNTCIKGNIIKMYKFIKKTIKFIPKKIAHKLLANTLKRIDTLQLEMKSLVSENYELKNKFEDLVLEKHKIENTYNTLENEISNLNYIQHKTIDKNQKISIDINELRKELNFCDDEKVKYFIYFHAGSRNHGCEALVKTIAKKLNIDRSEVLLHTFRKSDDIRYNMNKVIKYIYEPSVTTEEKEFAFMGDSYFNKFDMGITSVEAHLNKDSIALSIGGDNYCYGEYVCGLLSNYNKYLNNLNIKTALIGCSIEPDILKNENILRDLDSYSLVLARETITYNALIEAGINKNTHFIPDTAFILEPESVVLPNNFAEEEMIGLNISPLIQEMNNGNNIVFENYKKLINYIFLNTNYNITLIPHVFWEKSNDLEPLKELYRIFDYTGRIFLVEEESCEKLKGYISKCKMFIGARTHASIAAYSSFVPTIVIGYSVKSKGIAKDLFGTYENYVIPVENIKEEDTLINAFKWLEKNYQAVKNRLKEVIPEYIKPINKLSEYIKQIAEIQLEKDLPDENNCTGCGVCVISCPNNCITMKENSEGFQYPNIDYKRCSHCNLCKKSCPQNKNFLNNIPKICLAMKNKQENIRETSSSGGVFRELANYVMLNGGVVFGAIYDNNMRVEHKKIDKIEDIRQAQGSKYVQSKLDNIFVEVKEELNKGKLVLFSGTPCQIQALSNYLGNVYNNLLTVDIICHGVPSPKVFDIYKKHLENKYNSQIKDINFRNKITGWKNYSVDITFFNNKKEQKIFNENIYMLGFLQNLYLRNSCHNCTAKTFKSMSDITLGDCWGIEKEDSSFDDDKGCSLVLINTKQGEDFFKEIDYKFDEIDIDLSYAIENNISVINSSSPNKNRKVFFDGLYAIEDIEKHILDNLY